VALMYHVLESFVVIQQGTATLNNRNCSALMLFMIFKIIACTQNASNIMSNSYNFCVRS